MTDQPTDPLEGWTPADRAWHASLLPSLQPVAAKWGRPTIDLLLSAGQSNKALAVLYRRVRGNQELEQAARVLAGAVQTLASTIERSLGRSVDEMILAKQELETTLLTVAPPPSRIILPH